VYLTEPAEIFKFSLIEHYVRCPRPHGTFLLARNSRGRTVVHEAARLNNLDIVNFLLLLLPELHPARDTFYFTAADLARETGNTDIFDRLFHFTAPPLQGTSSWMSYYVKKVCNGPVNRPIGQHSPTSPSPDYVPDPLPINHLSPITVPSTNSDCFSLSSPLRPISPPIEPEVVTLSTASTNTDIEVLPTSFQRRRRYSFEFSSTSLSTTPDWYLFDSEAPLVIDEESILYHAIYADNLRLVQLLLFLHPRLLHDKHRLGNTAEIQFALHASSRRSRTLVFLAACYSAHPPRNPYQGTTAHKHFFNNYADQLGLPKLLPIT